MRHRPVLVPVVAALAALAVSLTGPPPEAHATETAPPRERLSAGLDDGRLARAIADDCTMDAAQILATVQGLGPRQQFTTVRHRGDFDARTPENSLAAFEESYVRCRPGVETDVRRTADDVLVMFHDTHVGKMLEPTYDPISGHGPNAALASLTWEQLRAKPLVDIERRPTDQRVPSLDDFLEHYVRVGGQSLLYLEVKNTTADKATSQAEIMDVVEQVAAFHRAHPTAGIFDRVVLKFRMSAFPLFDHWSARVRHIPGLPRVPLTQVQVSRQIARDVAADPQVPGSPGPGGGRLEAAVQSWAQRTATSDGVLSVEVTMKDSSGYANLELRPTHDLPLPFRDVAYWAPRAGSPDQPGTMARATQIVRAAGKPLGQFVPIPDWVMFRSPRTFSWDQVLPNVDVGHRNTPVTPREAFFNNNSACCYALRDRIDTSTDRDSDPEQNDQRILLPWLEDTGATFLTADDTDSIDAFFHARGKKLDTGDNRTSPNRPDPAMNSLIQPGAAQLPSLLKFVTVEMSTGDPEAAWFIQGETQISETRATAAGRSGTLNSRNGPVALMAVYGSAELRVEAAWSWLSDPSTLHDRTVTTWTLPDHQADGLNVWHMKLGSTWVRVRVSVTRQWAVADIDRVVIERTDRPHMWGTICGSAGLVATVDRCNPNDRTGLMIAEVASSPGMPIAPGGTVPLRANRLAGARPLAVTTGLWGFGPLDVPLSRAIARVDAQPWGEALAVSLPGDHGEAVVHYRVGADGLRVPLG